MQNGACGIRINIAIITNRFYISTRPLHRSGHTVKKIASSGANKKLEKSSSTFIGVPTFAAISKLGVTEGTPVLYTSETKLSKLICIREKRDSVLSRTNSVTRIPQ